VPGTIDAGLFPFLWCAHSRFVQRYAHGIFAGTIREDPEPRFDFAFPIRTRPLSPPAPMVLGTLVPGRIGFRQSLIYDALRTIGASFVFIPRTSQGCVPCREINQYAITPLFRTENRCWSLQATGELEKCILSLRPGSLWKVRFLQNLCL